MADDKVVSIPLIKFSAHLPRWPLEKNTSEWGFFPSIRVSGPEIFEGCYGVETEDESMAPVLRAGMVAVFSQWDSAPGLENIYSIGRREDKPLVRKVVKNEIPANENNDDFPDSLRAKRKSFMTPTPLHIPGSRVSPIAESTHQTIFLKSFANPEKLLLVPGGKLLWMHPLVLIIQKGK